MLTTAWVANSSQVKKSWNSAPITSTSIPFQDLYVRLCDSEGLKFKGCKLHASGKNTKEGHSILM